jgi:hypothetical protein
MACPPLGTFKLTEDSASANFPRPVWSAVILELRPYQRQAQRRNDQVAGKTENGQEPWIAERATRKALIRGFRCEIEIENSSQEHPTTPPEVDLE